MELEKGHGCMYFGIPKSDRLGAGLGVGGREVYFLFFFY